MTSKRIVGERPFQHLPRALLVAGAQQVHAELRQGPAVVRIDGQGSAHQGGRLVEAVRPGRMAARDAVDVAVGGVDREHAGDLRLEVGRAILEIGHGRHERTRLQAGVVDRQRPVDRGAGRGGVPIAELLLGDEQVRRDVVGMDLQGALDRAAGERRILVHQRARQPGDGPGPIRRPAPGRR